MGFFDKVFGGKTEGGPSPGESKVSVSMKSGRKDSASPCRRTGRRSKALPAWKRIRKSAAG